MFFASPQRNSDGGRPKYCENKLEKCDEFAKPAAKAISVSGKGEFVSKLCALSSLRSR
jgi:hypothetical protein